MDRIYKDMLDDFDAEVHASRISQNAKYDAEMDENWIDSYFEQYLKNNNFTEEEALAIAREFIEYTYMPSGDHKRKIISKARELSTD